MSSAHELPEYSNSLKSEMKQVVHCVGEKNNLSDILQKYAIQYARRFIRHINKEYPKVEEKDLGAV